MQALKAFTKRTGTGMSQWKYEWWSFAIPGWKDREKEGTELVKPGRWQPLATHKEDLLVYAVLMLRSKRLCRHEARDATTHHDNVLQASFVILHVA